MRGTIPWQQSTSRWPFTMDQLEIDLDHTALLAIDVQQRMGRWNPRLSEEMREANAKIVNQRLLPNVQLLLSWFRSRRMPVIHTRVGYALPGAKDMHLWRRTVNSWATYTDPGHQLAPEVAALPGELVLDKNASGAFVGAPLGFYLHNMGIQTIVVCGVATQACVQHTSRDAADLGYNVILVHDACNGGANRMAECERTFEVFGRVFGSVKTTAETLEQLEAVELGAAVGVRELAGVA